MNKHQIYCNYMAAKLKADELDVIANTMIRSAESDESLCQGHLTSGWQGDAMNLFRGKCSDVTQQRIRIARELRRIADTIRRVAERNYRAEMRALEIAQQRTYGSGGGVHG